jgi:amino acid permease
VHPIRAELSKASDMKSAVRISLVLCSAIYAAVGFFGFLLFGDDTMPDVLANFDRSSGTSGVPQALNDAARLSYALHLVLVFPLLHYSLRVNVDELLFPASRPLATDTRRFVALTAALMAGLYALAIAIPSIWTLFQYTGSTFAVCISLIFPGAIVLRCDIDNCLHAHLYKYSEHSDIAVPCCAWLIQLL